MEFEVVGSHLECPKEYRNNENEEEQKVPAGGRGESV